MGLTVNRVEALPDGAGLPLSLWYLVDRGGGTMKVPMSGPGGAQLLAVLAFTRRELAEEYLLMWRGAQGFPAGTRVRRLRRSDAEARRVPRKAWVETVDGKAKAQVRLAIDMRLGAERN